MIRTLCASALVGLMSLSGAYAQWPARWNPIGSADDEPRATTVDHRGNVFVVGRTKSFGATWQMEVIKYDSAGNKAWEAHWASPNPYDVEGQAVAVDWEGNVYCAGIAHGSQFPPTVDPHLVILKLNPGGFTVWPNSGSNAGLTYYNGAAMLASGQDGGDVSLAIRDVAGPQPIIAATCQTNVFNPAARGVAHGRLHSSPIGQPHPGQTGVAGRRFRRLGG